MFEFTDIVSDVLLEQVAGAPDWLKTVIKKHNELFGTTYPEDKLPPGIYQFVLLPQVNQKDMPAMQQYVHLVAFLRSLLRSLKIKGKTPATEADFLKAMEEQTVEGEAKAAAQKIDGITKDKKDDWALSDYDQKVATAYNSWLDEANKLATAALETYNNDSILGATQKIITKRTSVWDRISSLKSPTQPFTNLIVDIFKYPDQYIAGNKKVTQDFPDIVDDLYIQSLFRVGLAAKNFWEITITNLKTSSPQTQTGNQNQANTSPSSIPGALPPGAPTPPNTQQNQQQTQTSQGGVSRTTAPRNSSGVSTRTTYANAGLNLFDTYINSVLIQEGPIGNLVQTVRNYAGATKAGIQAAIQQRDPKVFKQVRDKVHLDNTNYMNFVTGKPVQYTYVDGDGKDLPNTASDTTDPKDYTVGAISKMKTQEAKALIDSLRDIAQYTKKGIGLGQAVSKTAGALGALRVGMGPVN